MSFVLQSGIPTESIKEFAAFLGDLSSKDVKTLHTDDLREQVLTRNFARLLVENEEVDKPAISDALSDFGLQDSDDLALCAALIIVENQIEINRALAAAAESTEEEEDVEEEDVEEDEEDSTFSKLMSYIIENYTYKEEFQAWYFGFLKKHPMLARLHLTFVSTKNQASTTWEYVKEKVKQVAALLGIDGLFLAIDEAAERSNRFRHILKTIGSVIAPVAFIAGAIWWVVRMAANPFQKFFRWLTAELDIQVPGGGEGD